MKIKYNSKSKSNMKPSNIDRKWKEKNKKYLRELQIFLDRVDNIQDGKLRQDIINQMLICDNVLTEIAEKMFEDFYIEGYKMGKKNNL